MAQSSNCPPVVLASWIGLTRVQQLFEDQLHAKPIKHARMVIGGASGSEVKMIDLATCTPLGERRNSEDSRSHSSRRQRSGVPAGSRV